MKEPDEGAVPSEVRETPGGLGRSGERERIRNQAPPGDGQNIETIAPSEKDSDHRLRGVCINHISWLQPPLIHTYGTKNAWATKCVPYPHTAVIHTPH